MRFRFRLGPFTFGRGGTRLSLWRNGSGVSIPLSGKGRSFGKIGIGPFSWFFGGPANTKQLPTLSNDAYLRETSSIPYSFEAAAIRALHADTQFRSKLQEYGVPWRGVQERLKQELPAAHFEDRDKVAYRLVSEAMDAIYGQQGVAWKTVKRPSKGGNGYTTWILAQNTELSS